MEETDMVNHPPHYNCYEHEVIELTSQLDFCMGNVAKYILRADHKGRKAEDLKKALWYLDYFNDVVSMNVDDYHTLLENDPQFNKLVRSYKSPLLVAILDDPLVDGRLALQLAIKDAEIEELKSQLAEEKAKPHYREGLTDKDWSEINKIFRQADDLLRDSMGNYKIWSMSR